MKPLLSRLAFWWAAPAAGLSLFLPAPLGSWLAALAVLAAGISLSLRGRWKPPIEAAKPDPATLIDDTALLDVTAQVVRCATYSRDLSEALHGVARILVHELGADDLVTARLDARPPHGSSAVGSAWSGGLTRARAAPKSVVALEATMVGRVAGSHDSGYAVPVLRDGRCVAWLEFSALELNVDPAALHQLLELVGRELSAAAQRCLAQASGTGALESVPLATADLPLADTPSVDDDRAMACGPQGLLEDPQDQHPLLTRYLQCCKAAAPRIDPEVVQAFDPTALERLRELDPIGVNRLLERIVRAFETSTARLLPQLAEAARIGDRDALRNAANTLKSASSSVGAIKLAMQCAEIETMTRTELHHELQSCIDAIVAEIEIVLSVLRGQPGPCR